MNIEEISINSKEYPQKLRHIYNPPKKLYVLGNKNILQENGIAIVGSRNASEYGKKVAFKFAKGLVQRGINIISGLALGIDSFAHLGAMQDMTEGKTIAVLGSGLDIIYPKQNIELARRIIKTGGCIVTEYKIGTSPAKMNFPQRNRIISGLSSGVLVVEAAQNSGALITADFAIEQGKEVFVIPGNIFSITSIGTNQLIKEGAKLVTNYTEIFDEI